MCFDKILLISLLETSASVFCFYLTILHNFCPCPYLFLSISYVSSPFLFFYPPFALVSLQPDQGAWFDLWLMVIPLSKR